MRRLVTILICLSLIVLAVSCRTGTRNSNATAIYHFGNLDSIMKGHIKAVYNLDSLLDKKNLYALGAMDSLAGEIQIFDSKPFHSTMEGDSVIVGSRASQDACLLIYAQIDEWRNISLPMSVTNQEALVGFLEYDEQLSQIKTDKPFIFLIEGEVEQLDWHILKKPQEDGLAELNDHKKNAGVGSLQDLNVEILGVYSKEHKGIFTHHNLPVHMHFKTSDGSLAGHVDEVEFGPDMRLRLPAIK